MTEHEAAQAQFHELMVRIQATAAQMAEISFFSAIERDSTIQALKAAAFDALMAHTAEVEQVMAAGDIQPDSELGQGILAVSEAAFGSRFYELLTALSPGGSA